MAEVKDLTELAVRDLWREVKGEEEWWGDIKAPTLQLVKRLLESAMEEEILEHVGVRRHERSEGRRGRRNGCRCRDLLTEFGLLDRIRVPRDREGSYRPGVLSRRQRQVDQMVREMFLSGVSSRRVQEVIRPLLEEGFSAQTVSRITHSLDAEVRRYHGRPIQDGYCYLLLPRTSACP
jgi:transposase-like protein